MGRFNTHTEDSRVLLAEDLDTQFHTSAFLCEPQ